MDLEKAKRTDPAARVWPATYPAFFARTELLKNTIKLDKFTGFFDKKVKETYLPTCFNTKSYPEI